MKAIEMSAIARDATRQTPVPFLAAEREVSARALMLAFAAVGLLFMVFPGTLLGVWNLIAISGEHAAGGLPPEWLQAHGHAQIFGWIGTFIIGIGYYSLPASRKRTILGVSEGWVSLALWASGAGIRWSVGLTPDSWRVLLPVGALLELAGFLVFFRASAGHRPERKGARLGSWALVVVGATLGFLVTILVHAWVSIRLAIAGETPAIPAGPNGLLLTLAVWAFVVPMVWGFTARWVVTMLGLAAPRDRHVLGAYVLSVAGLVAAAAGYHEAGATAFVAASAWMTYGLRIFERPVRRAANRSGHTCFAIFARAAYAWLLVGAALGVAGAAAGAGGHGYVGASRHALTVGFLSTMVFAIGPRILPAFTGRKLFSTRLMAVALATVTVGCTIRVVAQVLAYQGFAESAWSWLPVSAVTELTAFVLFAANLGLTFARR
jgi:uncharacterized protein involved in response to NO